MPEKIEKSELKVPSLHNRILMRVHAALLETGKSVFGSGVTARSAETYRKDLFPEYKEVSTMLAHLSGKFVVDIGSGLTHKNSYSLINLIAEQDDPETLFLGIDPAVGGKYGVINRLLDLLGGEKLDDSQERLPGEKYAINSDMPGTFLPKGSVDIFLTDFSIGYWTLNPGKLLEILKAVKSDLTPGGEFRIANALYNDLFLLSRNLREFVGAHFVYNQVSDSLLILTKK